MPKFSLLPALAVVALVPGLGDLARAAPVSGPYVSAGGGADLLQNQILPNVPTAGLRQRDLLFDQPGPLGELSAGWGFGNGLRVEIEGDYLNNHVRTVDGPVARRAGGVEQTYGGFANVLYDFQFGLPVQPYLGVGAGGQVLELDGFNESTNTTPFPYTHSLNRLGSFAYQAIAGFSVPVAAVPGLAFTADYRFMSLPDELPAVPLRVYDRIETGSNDGVATYRFAAAREGNQHIENIFHHSLVLGLRYAFDTAPPPPPAPPPAVAAPAPMLARTYLVFFDWDRASLTPRAGEIVAEAARNSTGGQATTIDVDGYADTSHALPGARGHDYNLRLSLRRADAVRAALVQDGVPAGAISVHGYGDTQLLVPTGPNSREPQNRRVEIVLR